MKRTTAAGNAPDDYHRLMDEFTADAARRDREWALAHPWLTRVKQFAAGVEALLYLLFIVDCFVLVAGVAKHPSYEPYGGESLIVILLAIALLRKLRGAHDY